MLKTVITEPRSHTWWPVGHIWLSNLIGLAGPQSGLFGFFLVMGWMLVFKQSRFHVKIHISGSLEISGSGHSEPSLFLGSSDERGGLSLSQTLEVHV